MTEQDRYLIIIKLKCCSAYLADKISTMLQNGKCDTSNQLILLNGLLELIINYNVTEEAPNCLTEDQFEEVVAKATNICNICDCNN